MNSAKERMRFNMVNFKEEGMAGCRGGPGAVPCCRGNLMLKTAPGMVGKEAGRKLDGARIGKLWARLRCMAGGAVWGRNGVNRSRRRCLEGVGLLG